jgi:molecular chaperone Hsp33
LRGYARVDEARAEALGKAPDFAALAGKGSMAITIEPRIGGKTYQGITELSPEGIAASAQTYFAQSEQLPTAIRIAAAPVFEPGKPTAWRAGGIMLQSTAEEIRGDVPVVNDDWERLKMFLATVSDFELVDTALPAEDLLWRLFHEDEARVLPFEPLAFRCDCSAGRIERVLAGYPADQRGALADPDGIIRARCEFCGTVHEVPARA